MKIKYKAIMLDLDGTTIPNKRDGMPSKNVINAINKANKKISVCIATGRSFKKAESVIDILQINTPVILLGGTQIIDGSSKEFIYERPLVLKDVITLLEILKPYRDNLIIDEKYDKVHIKDTYNLKEVFNLFIKSMDETVADKVIDTVSHIETVSIHKILSWDSGKVDLNISHSKATKLHAIYEVTKFLGITSHEIIGVGDGYNDYPLLMACGLKVAMGNAVPELKAIADYIAPCVEEDGVADVIEKFIL